MAEVAVIDGKYADIKLLDSRIHRDNHCIIHRNGFGTSETSIHQQSIDDEIATCGDIEYFHK